MVERIWDRQDLERFTKWEDPEVRFWAIDRLVRHYPDECCDAIAGFVLDDHELTPGVVARHLGEHGDPSHHAILLRGFRLLRGLTPGFCLQALARLGYPGVADLARSALQRGDLTEAALAIIAGALADLGTEDARQVVREFVDRKVELLSEPDALHAALRVAESGEISDVLARYLTALHWGGAQRAGEGIRTLMDALQIDDAGWCFRTGPSGRIELRKTIKAVESGYDCDILAAMGEGTIRQIAQRFRAGDLAEIVRPIAEWTGTAVAKLPEDPEDPLPERIAAAVGAFTAHPIVDDVEKMGHQFQQWVLGFQLSAAFSVARYCNVELSLKRSRGNLTALFELAERETAFLLPDLPSAIAVVCGDHEDRSRRAQDWCLRMLESQGPFFPKVVALETLGELRAVHFVPEIMGYLADENSYVYGAAERALSKMGDAIIPPAISRIENDALDPESTHSLLVLLCDLGTPAAHEAVARRLDYFMEEIGPGGATEWVSLFGTEDLIDPLRDWLEEDPAMVGQGLLLLGAIHNVRIPEEDDILRAIEAERARQEHEPDGEESNPGAGGDGGDYLM